MNKYIITGTLRNGKRFRPITTLTPWHYNIFRGTVWQVLENGKRKKCYTVWN